MRCSSRGRGNGAMEGDWLLMCVVDKKRAGEDGGWMTWIMGEGGE
jgi:hypothetical protein